MIEAMSQRQQVAQNLADICVFGGLNDVYGVNITKNEEKGKSFWNVTFCRARWLDGVIKVYSPNFILIKWQGRVALLPSRGQEVFRSERAAREFLSNNFLII